MTRLQLFMMMRDAKWLRNVCKNNQSVEKFKFGYCRTCRYRSGHPYVTCTLDNKLKSVDDTCPHYDN